MDLPFDERLLPPDESPFGRPLDFGGVHVGNRFCILPMEGWDGTAEGAPGELTRRRWRHFGESGAKLIWGGEAVAVRHDGRANPNQLLLTGRTQPALASLREDLVAAHRERFGANADTDLYVGLQLTHSGRFARPNVWNQAEPRAAYAHPVLDKRFPAGVAVMSDDEIDRLVEEFAAAARRAWEIGFQFVDIKHCHGYFLHELLSAVDRPGKYGGSLENRARFLFSVVDAVRASVPKLGIGVRLSAVDSVPYKKGPDGRGVPEVDPAGYRHGFGVIGRGSLDDALDDSRALLRLMRARDIRWVCISAGSPYYCPHLIRPALFPPLDGYLPPEEPLAGVARHVEVTARLKAEFPDMVFVGSGYTYLQEWLPHVAQYALRNGLADFVGIGRLVLSYPGMPADLLAGRPLQRKLMCRTFSDCTTGPRLGLVSGCYPLDPMYAGHPDAPRLKDGKAPASARRDDSRSGAAGPVKS